jgi:hypothetical protein
MGSGRCCFIVLYDNLKAIYLDTIVSAEPKALLNEPFARPRSWLETAFCGSMQYIVIADSPDETFSSVVRRWQDGLRLEPWMFPYRH